MSQISQVTGIKGHCCIRGHRHQRSQASKVTGIRGHRHQRSQASEVTGIRGHRHQRSQASEVTGIRGHRHQRSQASYVAININYSFSKYSYYFVEWPTQAIYTLTILITKNIFTKDFNFSTRDFVTFLLMSSSLATLVTTFSRSSWFVQNLTSAKLYIQHQYTTFFLSLNSSQPSSIYVPI